MRHRRRGKHFNRTPSHRKAMIRNMAVSLFRTDGGAEDPDNPGRIITMPQKAKECRRLVERLITLAKKGGVANLRRAIGLLGDKQMARKLFNEIAGRYGGRQGGYTRILHLPGVRLGDAAPQCIFELVEKEAHAARAPRAKGRRRKAGAPQPGEGAGEEAGEDEGGAEEDTGSGGEA